MMIKELSLTFAAVMLLGYVELTCQMPPTLMPRLCWTQWYSQDTPDATGDWETLKDLRAQYPGEICLKPRSIQAVTVDKEIPAEKTNQKFYVYNTVQGFICRNQDQKSGFCLDYKVRFRCPCFEV